MWIGKTHSEGIETFDIGVQYIQCSAKGLALHLAECFPSTVGRSLEFEKVKKVLAKNLEMITTTINDLRGEFDFIFHSQRRCLLIRLE